MRRRQIGMEEQEGMVQTADRSSAYGLAASFDQPSEKKAGICGFAIPAT